MTLKRTRRLDIYTAIKELREEHQDYPVCQLCRLGHVTRGAYYKWLNNPDSQNDTLNERIAGKFHTKEELIKAIEDYMDYYYNQRVQRNLGVKTPKEFHEQKLQQAA